MLNFENVLDSFCFRIREDKIIKNELEIPYIPYLEHIGNRTELELN